jgi:hypothetical protein
MLARERCVLGDAEAGGCAALAAARATLPSGVLQMVAGAVAALGGGTPRHWPDRRTAGESARTHCEP